MGRALIAASLMVVAGVAVNQILDGGKLSWSWGYLALVFTVLGALAQASPPAPEPPEGASRRRGSQRDYLRRVRSSVGQMETIGLVTQAEFVLRTQQVYVDVTLQPKTVSAAETDSGIGPTPQAAPPAVGRRAPLADFLTSGCVLAVLGAAGSGKTTLARHTALEMAERRWPSGPRRRLPVLLYLRDHAEALQADQPEGLPQVAVTARWLNGVISADWLERRLERGQCVILLDGLDEVADARHRTRVVRWVEAQISRYPGNSFVITSRPQGYDANRLTRADVLQVQRFTNRQIHTFLHAWYRAIERRARQDDPQEIDRLAAQAADDLFQRISGRPALYDLAANPLLLTMIANVHRYRGSLPGSRAALYEEVCQVLLHRRQEAKNLADGLNGDKKERIVQELALFMMRHHLRDIPVQDAQRAIRPILERTAPDLTPEAFLAQARRSGLLMERQYGRYGFAHLTLQEYLAAALIPGHPSRRQLLIDHVGDPWWRETTLLWAARADPGPVVEACLRVRTVTALNLAYACVAEAGELDPALRARLDALLTTDPANPEEVRLLDGVAAARELQDTQALDDEGTRICSRPISADLWNRYLNHTGTGAWPSGPADLWTADLKDFLIWLNGLFGDGISYRLPTSAEARLALNSDLCAGATLYAEVGPLRGAYGWASSVELVPAAPHLHPHRPTPEQIRDYPDRILDHTYLLFRLLYPQSALEFPQLLTYAQARDLTNPDHQLLHALDLLHTLDRLSLFDHARAARHAWSPVADRGLGRGRAITLGRALDLAHDLGYLLGGDIGGARVATFERDLDRVRAQVLDFARAQTHELHPTLTIDDTDPNRVYILARTLSRSLSFLNTESPYHARDSSGFRLDLESAFTFGLSSERARDPDLTADVDDTLNLIRCLDSAGTHDFSLDFDLAFARALARSDLASLGVSSLMGLGRACDQLMRHLLTSTTPRRGRGQELRPSMSDLLHQELGAVNSWPPADDPAVALERALHFVGTHNVPVLGFLIENALRLAAPLWDRSRPVRQSDMVPAVTCVLAALVSGEGAPRELAHPLRAALATLMALTPDSATSTREKQLILVRD
ncbi:NACHT domain-containing protein [Actinomadura litoris]|uniref:NACHT domain-containing protein n=1 Tax=Actinomadura litoris TaxID=2678616 RepID=A0A7K1KUU5_9ACTN|nr:NACHT domain-containing protein [Actinomadura litoris]MUN35805.1 NACHT domain-containing protein [Actinomadura litoris]